MLQWLARFVLPALVPEAALYGIIAGIAGGGLAVLLWWLFFSRAAWAERVGALALMVAGVLATSRFVDKSIANGMMGMMLPMLAVPVLSLALVASAAATRRLPTLARRRSMAVTILIACTVFTLIRTGGIRGDAGSDLHWRWTATPEERLLAQTGDEPALPSAPSAANAADQPLPPPATAVEPKAPPTGPSSVADRRERRAAAPAADESALPAAAPVDADAGADWPGFRGPSRDGIVRGVRIETDWSRKPPTALWRRPIGPGWSSFAVHGNLLYTQEQRGEDELVSSYKLTTGEPVWRHRDAARFWESNAGAGPRGTPTISHGRIYALGATGIVNALDARTGSVIWSRNAAADTGAKIPGWGFTSSPLIVNDLVIVAASGRLAAYDVVTGTPRWFSKGQGGSYSSPHLMTIDGVQQVLMLTGGGVTSVAPANGARLWEYQWPGSNIVQPALTADGGILIAPIDSVASGVGTRRIAVTHGSEGWNVQERWTSSGLKPSFNDFVVHDGHAFGFDGGILACIDLKDGRRTWKGGRFGHGQIVLLSDQDLLLVLSEEGELALVRAAPDQFTELVRVPALEGKTWNHPVLVGDVLLVRNGEEMAAFRLSLAER